jgi:hypothetical protein
MLTEPDLEVLMTMWGIHLHDERLEEQKQTGSTTEAAK